MFNIYTFKLKPIVLTKLGKCLLNTFPLASVVRSRILVSTYYTKAKMSFIISCKLLVMKFTSNIAICATRVPSDVLSSQTFS